MPPQPTDAASGRIAAWAGAVVVAVLAATLAGAALDMWRRRRAEKAADARQLPGWAAGMLASSYALLLPGLFAHLFVARTWACVGRVSPEALPRFCCSNSSCKLRELILHCVC